MGKVQEGKKITPFHLSQNIVFFESRKPTLPNANKFSAQKYSTQFTY